jgi:DNA invertase Pin-like site-specific DNA recombinase
MRVLPSYLIGVNSMTYRQLKPRQVVPLELVETELTAEQVAAYLRQSSDFQVLNNTESADMQLTGALRYAVSRGLNADKIVIAHEGEGKRGVSGTLHIDQREKLQEIVMGIKDGTIKVVWAYSVSRLFRDPYGVQVAVFIGLCAEHGVKVIIENAKTFDFTNSFDVMMFQFLANVAAKENADRSLLMNGARRRKSLRGGFDGRPLVVGYIVDRVKLLADGKPNPTYGKFVEYAPHARVVRRLYARFRELGGQFNLLAAEVARMDVVFPDFEDWVSPLDVSKLQLKKVPNGYCISRVGLFHLMTAVEYIGYWKVDGSLLTDDNDKPVVNHDAIVPFSDWEYAFNHLSFTTLDGLPNPDRTHGSTWTPATKQEKRGALHGLLTSTLGLVDCTGGYYRIAEQREGHSQRSSTLVIHERLVDSVWYERLSERMREIDGNKFFNEQVAKLKQQHARALVTVDEQLARYYRERAGIQAFIAATGATADKATLRQYNKDLLQLTANINDLEHKKQTAAAEESALSHVRERLKTLLGIGGSNEYSRNFIQLVTDKIILDEYSAHFLTLTIVWSAPFQQTDRAYIYRPDGSHQQWSDQEKADLTRLYPYADKLELLQRFPTRTWLSISYCTQKLGLRRYTELDTSGLPNNALSLKDWQLIQEYGWELPEKGYGRYWLYDIVESSPASDELTDGAS